MTIYKSGIGLPWQMGDEPIQHTNASSLPDEPQTSKQASPSPSETQLTLQIEEITNGLVVGVSQNIRKLYRDVDNADGYRNEIKLGIETANLALCDLFQQALTSLKSEMEKKKKTPTEDEFLQYNHGFNFAISECQRVIDTKLEELK